MYIYITHIISTYLNIKVENGDLYTLGDQSKLNMFAKIKALGWPGPQISLDIRILAAT